MPETRDRTDPIPALALALAILAAATLLLPGCAGRARRVVLVSPGRQEPDLKVDPAELIEQVVAAHNEARAEEDLPPLNVSPKLTAAAERHARDMADRRKMTHTGGDGTGVDDRVAEAGYAYRRVGENVAYGRMTTQELMKGWLDSPGHRKNILGGYSDVGVARATSADGTPYWCVTFGLPRRR